jgi:hypothetical protein
VSVNCKKRKERKKKRKILFMSIIFSYQSFLFSHFFPTNKMKNNLGKVGSFLEGLTGLSGKKQK